MHNTETTRIQQAQQVADYIRSIDLKPIPLAEEFFYASLPLCVIDAVFSIGVTYTSTQNTVTRFCKEQGWQRIDLSGAGLRQSQHSIMDFLELFKDLMPKQCADDLFGNLQRTSTRSGILKAEAVKRFDTVLEDAGINEFCDLTDERLKNAETAIRDIPGQGSGISFDYFRMLAGDDDLIKPDRMVQRFIGRAIDLRPDQVTPQLARDILQKAIPLLEPYETGTVWSARQLDYAIWVTENRV